jgi:tRNA (cmo5U34)-methyltransferase
MSHSHAHSPSQPSHSVEQHLQVSVAGYDADIRRFVPHYDEALGVVAAELGDFDGHVLDVGTGTGALIGHLARHCPRARFTGLDLDPAMLEQAKLRLREFGERVRCVHAAFLDARGPVDAVVASLSLHHVPSREDKVRVYAHLRSVAPVLISADAMVPREPQVAEKLWNDWAAHLVRGGDSPEGAQERFESWKREDFYFSVAEELAMLREAGFSAVELRWRRGPLGVLVARRYP